MDIQALTKKNPFTWDIFLLLVFLIFMLYSPDRFSLFGIDLGIQSGLPLAFVFTIYLKLLFSFAIAGSLKAILLIPALIIGLATVLLAIYIIANKTAQYISKKPIPGLTLLDSVPTKYLLVFLFIIAFSFRLYYMSPGMFHIDTVQLASAVEKTLDTGIMQPAVSKSYGLVILNAVFYAIPHYIFGVASSISTLNFTSVLFGSLAIPLVFLFTKEIFGKFAGISAALLFSFQPVFLSISTHGKDHAHAIFFILLAGWSLMKALNTDKNPYKILFGLSLGFSLFIRFPSILALIPFGLLYIIAKEPKMERYSLRNVLLISVPFLILLAGVLYFQYDSIMGQKEANDFLSFSNLNFDLARSFFHAFTSAGLFLSVYGIFSMLGRKKNEALALLLYSAVLFLFFSGFISVSLRFFTEFFLVASIFAGYAVFHLREKYGIFAVVVLILVLISSFVSVQPVLSYRSQHATGNYLIDYMESITEKNALIVDYGDYVPYYEYASFRSAVSCPLTDDAKMFSSQMEFIYSQKRPIYISQACFAFGTEEQKKQLLSAVKEKYSLKEAGRVRIDDFHKSEVSFDTGDYKIFKLIPNILQPALGNNLVSKQDSQNV